MCTVSVLRAPWTEPSEGAATPLWRAVFSRDELRKRSPAVPPVVATYAGVPAIHPIDPVGQGTWLAASGAGMVFALLNEASAAAPTGQSSRGMVIPALLSARSLDEVEARLRSYPSGKHRPFRLLAVSDRAVVEAVHAWGGLCVRRLAASPRLVRTSSSVEPIDTQKRRTALFDHLVPVPSLAAQDRFHAHRWPLASEASVLMTRPDARTVSVTVVDVFARGFRVTYRALPAGPSSVTEVALAA